MSLTSFSINYFGFISYYIDSDNDSLTLLIKSTYDGFMSSFFVIVSTISFFIFCFSSFSFVQVSILEIAFFSSSYTKPGYPFSFNTFSIILLLTKSSKVLILLSTSPYAIQQSLYSIYAFSKSFLLSEDVSERGFE